LKGVGPLKADVLKKELNIFTFKDLTEHYPLRYIDRTTITPIASIDIHTDYVQVKGKLLQVQHAGHGRGRRLTAVLRDATGILELAWFQGLHVIEKVLREGEEYYVYGKTGFFNQKPQMVHPDMELVAEQTAPRNRLEPVYPTTEKLKSKGLNGRQLSQLTAAVFTQAGIADFAENIPESIVRKHELCSRFQAVKGIHFPSSKQELDVAVRRLKFEEFFIAQVRLQLIKIKRQRSFRGVLFAKVGELFNSFYNNYLPFSLTEAQKRVLKEIRNDCGSEKQMNRLLQGDVGSGKTVVALLAMLLAADNGFQACLMAPTEILARQHFDSLKALLKDMPVTTALLTGTTKQAERKTILKMLANGDIHFLIGTHALIEDAVKFKTLGLAIVDEQHRFGVEQRARLWKKSAIPPHILVMTATPIPRTLAMTAYGDLDYSVIDELPPGRKPIYTVHRNEMARASVMNFVRSEIEKGRQAYFIYPLIEESEKLSYEDLMQGYEQVKSFFPEPRFYISMVHGKQPAEQKQTNMERFVTGKTNIMVSTTVIEVGVNVPNASVMVIESAEKFGLSQLHQLRGRVGRGSEKSYCILLTGSQVSEDAKQRMQIMCATNDGFKIAEKDLELRGPGDIEGTKQSGILNFKLASITQDKELLDMAKYHAEKLVERDPTLDEPENIVLKQYLVTQKGKTVWSKIS